MGILLDDSLYGGTEVVHGSGPAAFRLVQAVVVAPTETVKASLAGRIGAVKRVALALVLLCLVVLLTPLLRNPSRVKPLAKGGGGQPLDPAKGDGGQPTSTIYRSCAGVTCPKERPVLTGQWSYAAVLVDGGMRIVECDDLNDLDGCDAAMCCGTARSCGGVSCPAGSVKKRDPDEGEYALDRYVPEPPYPLSMTGPVQGPGFANLTAAAAADVKGCCNENVCRPFRKDVRYGDGWVSALQPVACDLRTDL